MRASKNLRAVAEGIMCYLDKLGLSTSIQGHHFATFAEYFHAKQIRAMKVKDIMTENVISVTRDTPIQQAIQLLAQRAREVLGAFDCLGISGV